MLLVALRLDEQQVVLVGPGRVGSLRDNINRRGGRRWDCSRAGGQESLCVDYSMYTDLAPSCSAMDIRLLTCVSGMEVEGAKAEVAVCH